jgi:hypothetical protein
MADGATESLVLKIKALGAHLAERDIDRVTKALKEQDRATHKLNRSWRNAINPGNAVARALRLTATRAVIATGAIIILSVALAALSPGLAFVTAGLVALVAAFGPLAALGFFAANQFKNQFEIAGTAANELMTTFLDFRHALETAMGPAADIILRSLARALMVITPLIGQLAPAFTVLAQALGEGIIQFAQGITAMGPELAAFITGLVPVIPKLVTFTLELIDALLELAIKGLPPLLVLLDWGIDFLNWLERAIIEVDRFLRTTEGTKDLEHLKEVMEGFWWVLKQVAKAAFFVTTQFSWLSYLIGGLLAIGALTVLVGSLTFAFELLALAVGAVDLAFLANPVTWFLLSLVALTAAIIWAVQNWDLFRLKIGQVWELVKQFTWEPLKWGLEQVVNFIVGKINWLIDQMNWAIRQWNSLPFGHGAEVGQIAHVGTVDFGTGGDVAGAWNNLTSGNMTPTAAAPHGDAPDAYAQGTPVTEMASPYTIVLDGKVLARGVHRASTKKKSTK